MYIFYNISSPFPRHKKYIKIFNASKNHGIHFDNYIESIIDFVNNKKLSPDNSDDVECFSHLIFDSAFGNLHILCCSDLFFKFENSELEFNDLVFLTSKYLNYLNKVGKYLVDDVINYISSYKNYQNSRIISLLFNLITSLLESVDFNCKLTLANILVNNKEYVENIPKIKLYAIFS